MTKDIDLLDAHRDAWTHLLGQRKVFRGKIKRLGHKHRQGSDIKKGATLLLVDVHLVRSSKTIDHAWIEYTPELAQFGEHIRPNGTIEFEALVTKYIEYLAYLEKWNGELPQVVSGDDAVSIIIPNQ